MKDMDKIFGNDGFRSEFGKKYMTIDFLTAFSNALSYFLNNSNNNTYPVLIGRDTRESGKIIEKVISGVLNYFNINVILVGEIPTPGLSYLMSSGEYFLGIMITASHNPSSDNGIKLFGHDGDKLKNDCEREIEEYILSGSENEISGKDLLGKTEEFFDKRKDYFKYLLDLLNINSINKKILIDCSNGAFSGIVSQAKSFSSSISFINCSPNGSNINLKCGALEPGSLLETVRKNHYDYGVAFDGDGDRAIFVEKDYGVIETEKLIVLFSKLLATTNNYNMVVSTSICNKGLEENLIDLGITLTQTQVGDRNVINEVKRNKGLLGVEPSGHYFFPGNSTSMDGFMAFIYFVDLINIYGDELKIILKSLKHYNRIQTDVPINLYNSSQIRELSAHLNSSIDNEKEKLVIRESMWDPVLRIYYDYDKVNNYSRIEKILHEFNVN
jgi:phosphoglucosamine mutase|tara:strand:+ start:6028 stop:7353 length:1326 start_codon:yes stop_codon:yes gene_type:complete